MKDPQRGTKLLKRYIQQILELIHEEYPCFETSYASISGIEAGCFTPLGSIGRELQEIAPSELHNPRTLIASKLSQDEEVFLLSNVDRSEIFPGDQKYKHKLVIKLIGSGELFGFISLDSTRAIDQKTIDEVKELHHPLSRVLGESVFSMRLWSVANSFERTFETYGLDELYSEICDRALLAFASCGVVLRIYDPETGRMQPEMCDGNVDGKLLEDGSAGEIITKLVFDDKEFSWTIGMLPEGEDPIYSGTKVPSSAEEDLLKLGIKAYAVFRLQSDSQGLSASKKVGTLSFFHRHSHRFSWRDIALATSLSQRAADIITLFNKQKQLESVRDELSFANHALKLEASMMTRMEIVTLLAHDLGHKAISARNGVEKLISEVKKAFRLNAGFNSVKKQADEALELALNIQRSLHHVNTLFEHEEEDSSAEPFFSLYYVIEEMALTMSEPLQRYNMSVDMNIPTSLNVQGDREILLQVLFNLLINSIDAQKERRKRRKNSVHIHANLMKTGLEEKVFIKFWDEGPGIDMARFQNPTRQIFELGETTKEKGTGRGLTISRNLLNKYFSGGDLKLSDPLNAHFQIVLPRKK